MLRCEPDLYLCVSAEEAVGERDAELEVHGAQHIHLCGNHLRARVSVVADVQEIFQNRWAPLLLRRHVCIQGGTSSEFPHTLLNIKRLQFQNIYKSKKAEL